MIIALHVFLTFASLVVLLLSIYKREAKRALYIIYSLFAVFLFNLGYLVEVSALVIEISILGKQLKYLGLPFIAPALLLFVLDYYGYKALSKLKVAALLAIPVIHCIFAITTPWSGLLYSSMTWVADAPRPYMDTGRTIYYFIGFFYSYILTMSVLGIAIFRSRGKINNQKKQSYIIIASAAIPGIGNAINVLAPINMPFDPTALLLTAGCGLLAYSFIRLNLLQIAPIAREQIIENLHDAFVLVDRDKCFVDSNEAAKKLFPQLAAVAVGTPIEAIEEFPWSGEYTNMDSWTFDLLDKLGVPHHYTISKTVITHQNEIICDCLMIYDVTESQRLLDELSVLVERDTLTGLFNRRTFFNRGEWLFQEISSIGGKMSVLMMDLDDFKKLNDKYGHQVGDIVLATVAQKLAERFRSTDLFARYGGEEFCALLPRTDEKSAMRIALQLREITEQIDWGSAYKEMRITISIGVAVYDAGDHNSLHELIGSADTALYAAKNAGRNTVRNYLNGHK